MSTDLEVKPIVINNKVLDQLFETGVKRLFPDVLKIAVQMGTCGKASGADDLYTALKEQLSDDSARITIAGCIGLCQREPMINVFIPGFAPVVYADMTPELIRNLLPEWKKGILPSQNAIMQLDHGLYGLHGKTLKTAPGIPLYSEIPSCARQQKIALRNCGFIDPEDITEYVARNGYFSICKGLQEPSPDDIIDQVKRSGLRGRGGGGFPTGLKWEFCRKSQGTSKYIICNADEGDPGAYMDRSIIESDPHSVIEGMLIGALAIGAQNGYIYIRAEYPLARQRLTKAIEEARNHGLLGNNILESDFSFDIEIVKGAGAFVCGEETSLIASIEGRPPEPMHKPPFPAVSGVWKKPTNINNVETWACVPPIIFNGAQWFAGMGTETCKGTKVFSLVGKVKNTGLVEVAMGATLREVIFDIGGGIPDGKKFKAVQTGGPSGGCIPASLLDLPIDYEKLTQIGSIMGSGGMIVMDESTCMVDIAKYFLTFTSEESCGKCTSCREGSLALLEVLDRICKGNGTEDDLVLLEDLSYAIKDASMCGLGQTLPNPVLATFKYFKDEYIAHTSGHTCPAKVCKDLITFRINKSKCVGCTACARKCPVNAITGEKKQVHEINQTLCIKCGVCKQTCFKTKNDAIIIE